MTRRVLFDLAALVVLAGGFFAAGLLIGGVR